MQRCKIKRKGIGLRRHGEETRRKQEKARERERENGSKGQFLTLTQAEARQIYIHLIRSAIPLIAWEPWQLATARRGAPDPMRKILPAFLTFHRRDRSIKLPFVLGTAARFAADLLENAERGPKEERFFLRR